MTMDNKQLQLEILKRDLRRKKRTQLRNWEDFWWVLWIFIPVIGWLFMIIILIKKLNRTVRLENDCNDLRDQIRELENEIMKEKLENKL
ncbi:DUF805 domain-containing protein [endosymbiont GvMRE of Glomus versiforme]|uniref:DUF805 domain-containing protein n=1 Tax=endosymbiont GvMRE of Glomus versiforme TaxID=2039283 RepID=UPI000EDCEE8B|nr:DUF805 domain-containing protein [endosymbiont GvMRE of Glomus versiforme]RHZ37012.1 hypothetical protein GvMRE_I2g340 [endosymbiont GvMRE of Glomus versiforme]